MNIRRSWLVAAALFGCALQSARAETFESLAARIPGEANALVLIDVEQTMAAPLAQEQGWARKLETAYVERPVYLPPEAKKLVLGAALQPTEDFLGTWEVAVMELAEPIGVRALARSESGYVDEVSGVSAAITPRDAAFVDLGNNVLAVMHPAERQFLARWISFARDKRQSELSPYLQTALRGVNDRVQVLLAVDLTDVLGPRDIEAKLADPAWAAAIKADAAAVGAVVGKLQGIVLRLAIGKECKGQLQIDFDADVAPLGKSAGPIVLQALSNMGFQTEELAKWEVTLAGHSIRMQGVLSADAQRRVFSVIELPAADLGAAGARDGAAATESEVRERSVVYFKSTESLVNDLRKGLKDTKASSAWMERYARRIDELSVLNVDELLVDYGDKLAETLRIMANSKRQAGIRAGVRGSQDAGYYDYDGYYSSADAYDRAAARSQAKKEEMSVANDTRVEGWRLIDDATADLRRTLTKKYGVDF